jgi:phage terminase small subunit
MVQEAVAAGMEKRSQRVEITQDSVLFEMAYSGYSNMQNYIRKDELGNEELIPVSELTPEEAAAIIEWSRDADGKMKIKLADKHRPLVDIGRHLGMFPSNVQVTGKDGKDLIPRLDINDRVALGRALAFTLAEAAHNMPDENAEPKQE